MSTLGPRDIVTVPCRLAFPALFEPRAVSKVKPDDKKWQAVILIPDSVDLAPFYEAIKEAMIKKFGKQIKLPASKNPIHECEEKDLEGYEDGWHYINTKSGYQPQVVDQRLQDIINPQAIYSGCWCRFCITAWAWDHPEGGRGVSFSLNSVQMVRDDDRLDGRPSNAGEIFEAIDTDDDDMQDEEEEGAEKTTEDASQLFG